MSDDATVLGTQPRQLRVLLPESSDFYCTRTYRVNGVVTSWPVGTTLALEFEDGTSWTATIVGSVATYDVDQALADTKGNGMKVKTVYTNGTTRRVWEMGTVVRFDG